MHLLHRQSHRQIYRPGVLGQRADGDIVNAGFGDIHQRLGADVSRGLELGPVGGEFDALRHVRQAKIVQHDDVGTGFQGDIQLIQGFYFHLHRLARRDLSGGGYSLVDTAAGGDVVFLDQKGVIEADAVVVAAAAGHRVFLGGAQAGDGFAGIQQFDGGVGDQVRILLTGGRGAGKQLQVIEGGALAGEQGGGRTVNFAQHGIGGDQLAIPHAPLDCDRGLKLTKNLLDPLDPADHRLFAGDQGRGGGLAVGDQTCSNVAVADVFAQGKCHRLASVLV